MRGVFNGLPVIVALIMHILIVTWILFNLIVEACREYWHLILVPRLILMWWMHWLDLLVTLVFRQYELFFFCGLVWFWVWSCDFAINPFPPDVMLHLKVDYSLHGLWLNVVNKAEPSRELRCLISHDHRISNMTKRREICSELIVSNVLWQSANE